MKLAETGTSRDSDGSDDVARPAAAHLSVKRQRYVVGSDIRETLLVGLSALTAVTCPVERWTAITDQFYRLDRGPDSGRFRTFRRRVAAFYGSDVDDAFAAALWRACHIARHRRRMLIVAKRFRRNYPLEISFEGRSRLEAGLSAGVGVILWFDNFRHHTLVGKYPFAEAGYASWQLSSVDHGFSRSQFGKTFLNPIQLFVENEQVAKRIAFSAKTALAATREVRARLAENGIVRITNNAYIGRQIVRVPFGAAASLPIATTPINLARTTGATLLPVAVVEKVPFRRYSVTIGRPIVVDNGGSRNTAERRACQDYADYLAPLVRAYPEQWMMWFEAIDHAVRSGQPR